LGAAFGVPVADSFGTVGEITDFIAKGRALSGVEGFVIAFEDGNRLKL
jgi:RNA ligase